MGTKWMSAQEAAEYSGFHLETVRDALRSGQLKGTQRVKSGTWRTNEDWVDTWLGAAPASAAA